MMVAAPGTLLLLRRRGREGFKAAIQWTAIELGAAWGLGALLLISMGWDPSTPSELPASSIWALVVPLAASLLFLTSFFRRKIHHERLDFADLGYHRSLRTGVAGLTLGTFLILLVLGTEQIDLRLFPGLAKDTEELLRQIAQGGSVAAGALLVVNGGFAPIVEELVWRGYIQTKMTQAWGTWFGITATALLFAGKHMLVDASFNRTTTLLVGAVALGVVRQWRGTTASTVAHLLLNLVATAYGIAEAFWG